MPLVNDEIIPLTNADLTSGAVGGSGAFDVLIASMKAHLMDEYSKNRITGEQYVKAYIAMMQSAMAGAVQFLLGRDIAYWQEVNAETQKLLILEQTEAARAQTMNTRSDGITVITGSIGKQKDLYTQQITSYQRDSEVKVAKLFTDAWITMKTIDEGLSPPDGFVNANLDKILAKLQLVTDLD